MDRIEIRHGVFTSAVTCHIYTRKMATWQLGDLAIGRLGSSAIRQLGGESVQIAKLPSRLVACFQRRTRLTPRRVRAAPAAAFQVMGSPSHTHASNTPNVTSCVAMRFGMLGCSRRIDALYSV